ncbi:phosphoribosylglycinamide synthetase C domain-containing protein [Coxiella-like endosymbiont of Rhipicephalus sanguineus]|uniref:phosphoribosylglycinamide synthetase C domain-containing protein n=1 Tax=Coxiella-like endosymbiont of Rhipicephalus sanguineus TaxID=1955402 RepID=UPI002041C714|nr:phosphoribosylglycinamide synthetase C domain-containing protein [Coxiella-like endosymbiont of Rhipicephalus sanguineus]
MLKFFMRARKNHNGIVTDGGRILSVTALGIDLRDAQQKAYRVVDQISWPCNYRNNIGYRPIT